MEQKQADSMSDSAKESMRELANAPVLAERLEQLTHTVEQLLSAQQTLTQDLKQMASQHFALQTEVANVNNKLQALQGQLLQQQQPILQQQQGQTLASTPSARQQGTVNQPALPTSLLTVQHTRPPTTPHCQGASTFLATRH